MAGKLVLEAPPLPTKSEYNFESIPAGAMMFYPVKKPNGEEATNAEVQADPGLLSRWTKKIGSAAGMAGKRLGRKFSVHPYTHDDQYGAGVWRTE